MDINLPLLVTVWVVVTAIDGAVVLYRMKLTSQEVTGIRIEDTETELPEVQKKFAKTIEKFNSYVKWLTTARTNP